MKKVIIIILLFYSSVVYADRTSVTLSKCIDGDTARFINNGKEVKVRFLSIDAPEIAKEGKKAEAYGEEASAFTCTMITNAKNISLETDEKSDFHDKYGRILAWVWVDDKLLQSELVKNGFAKVKYTYDNYKYASILKEQETIAKNNKKNIWSDYVPLKYTVIFIYDDKKKTIEVDENSLIKQFIPYKKGYKFIGWMNNNKYFDFNTKINCDITLEAKFEKDDSYLLLFVILIILILLSFKKMKKIKAKKKNRRIYL